MKTHIRHQQHKNIKHQDIKQKGPPQKYRLGLTQESANLYCLKIVDDQHLAGFHFVNF